MLTVAVLLAVATFRAERGVQLRCAAIVCSATEAVFLKRAVLHSSPVMTFYMWVVLGTPLAGVAAVMVVGAVLIVVLGRGR